MRFHLLITVLILATAAAGCSTIPADPPPPPSPLPVAGETTMPVPPPPAKAPPPHPICTPVTDRVREATTQRLEALVALLAEGLPGAAPEQAADAVKALAGCLSVTVGSGSNGRFMVVTLQVEGIYNPNNRVAVWNHRGTWNAAQFPVFDAFGSKPESGIYQETADGAEVLSVLRNGGSGHAGAFVLLHLGTEMTVRWRSPLYGYFDPKFLSSELLFGTYRESSVYQEPHVYNAGCCYPTNGQILWERQGDTFVLKASRAYPSIRRAASAFAAAWNEKKLDQVSGYILSPEILGAMLRDPARPDAVTLWEPDTLKAIELAEAGYWEALPPEHRGPKPALTEFVWPAQPRPLLMRRVDGEWKVAGWH